METARVTGGSVCFVKRVNRGNYEHEEATTRLDFVVPEGNDYGATLKSAEVEARFSVLCQLVIERREETPRPLAQTRSSLEADIAAGKSPKPRHVKSAAILAQEAKEEAAAIVQTNGPDYEDLATVVKNASAPAVAAADGDDPLAPAGVSQVPSTASSPAPSSTATASSVTGDDPLAPASVSAATVSTALTGEFTAQREVTDADLATAAAKNNERLVKLHKEAGTVKIRDLIGKFLPPGKPLRELPQAERAGFLAKLEALS